jgi:hypothetical protein
MARPRRRTTSSTGGVAIAAGLVLAACGGGTASPPDDATAAASPDEGAVEEVEAEVAVPDEVEDAVSGGGSAGGDGASVRIDGEDHGEAVVITCNAIGITVQGLAPDGEPYLLGLTPLDVQTAMLDAVGQRGEAGGAHLVTDPFQATEAVLGTAETFLLDGGSPTTTPGDGSTFAATGTLDGVGDFEVSGTC